MALPIPSQTNPILYHERAVWIKGGNAGGTPVDVKIVAPLGQAAMAASIPVVIASNQSNVPVNLVQVGGAGITLGQKTTQLSFPVVLAPRNLSYINVVANSGAVANAAVTAQILAAPGIGLAYRIWKFIVSPNNSAQAVVNWTMALTNFPVTVGYARMARPNFLSGELTWDSGLLLPVNTAVGYHFASALALLVVDTYTHYTIE